MDNYVNSSFLLSSIYAVKQYVIGCFLCQIDRSLFPQDMIKMCTGFCDLEDIDHETQNHEFIMFALRLIMTKQRENKNLTFTNIKELQCLTIKDNEIQIFDTFNDKNCSIDAQLSDKRYSIKIIVMNDLNLQHLNIYNITGEEDIYIQCNNLYLSQDVEITTDADDADYDVHYKQHLANYECDAFAYGDYELVNIYINVENNIKMRGNAAIRSGFIYIYCGNDLEMLDGANITSYGGSNDNCDGVKIICGNNLKIADNAHISAYSESINIECRKLEIASKGHITASEDIHINKQSPHQNANAINSFMDLYKFSFTEGVPINT